MSQAERTQPCSTADARTRLRHARSFAEVAALVADEGDDVEYSTVAASLCVLAGIAASDAACCKELGMRSRGQDHREAAALIGRIEPGGAPAAKSLLKLLQLKDEAHYGLMGVSGANLRAARRQAQTLVEFAERALAR